MTDRKHRNAASRMGRLLLTLLIVVLGVLLANICHHVYYWARCDIDTDPTLGLFSRDDIMYLSSPLTFCGVHEVWSRKPFEGQDFWKVVASFSPLDKCFYLLENETAGAPPDKLTASVETGDQRLEFRLSHPDDACVWRDLSVVLGKGAAKKTYTFAPGHVIPNEIQLPGRE